MSATKPQRILISLQSNMDLKKEINEYLKTQRLMAVATYGDAPWIANVYYVHDDDLNLYFLSKKERIHCLAIEKNENVAVAIADSHQPFKPPQIGIQLNGTAHRVNVLEQIGWMFQMWNKLYSGDSGELLENPQKFLDAGLSSVYKIIPKRIKFFHTGMPEKEMQTRVLDL